MSYDFDIELVGVTLSPAADADPTEPPAPNTGDTTDGHGVAAAVTMLAPIGFYGAPAATSADGKSTRVCQLTIGNERMVIAGADRRDLGNLASGLGPGDRAILSSGTPARLELRRSTNSIGLHAANGSLVLGASNLVATYGANTLTMTSTSTVLQYDSGGTTAKLQLSAFGAVLSYTTGGVTASITLGAGTVNITAPSGMSVTGPLTVNGLPVP